MIPTPIAINHGRLRWGVPLRLLPDRASILEAANHHPFARVALGSATGPRGLHLEMEGVKEAVFWWGDMPLGRAGAGLGDQSALDAALAHAHAEGLIADIEWINLPRRPHATIPDGWVPANDDWDYRWLPNPTPTLAVPNQDAAGPVVDAAEIGALLDVAFPGSMLRPGHPMVREWYGVWSGPRLVACAADRSVRSPDPDATPTGMLGAIAVHPDHRGQGWGAAVTAALATALAQRYEQVGLGVSADNHVAQRLYHRLGFTGRHEMTPIRPA